MATTRTSSTTHSAPLWLRYGGAVALFLAALATRFALIGVLPERGFPFLTFCPAVLLAAFLAGLWPSVLVAVLSIVAAWYFFIDPGHAFLPMTQSDVVALVFFSAVLFVDCIVVHLMNTALAQERRTEALLRESEHRLRLVLDKLYAYVGLLDLDGTLREINEAPLRPRGLSREQILGRPLWETPWWAASAAARDALREAVARAATGETVRYDATIERQTGESIVIDLQLAPLHEADGRISGIVASGMDVTPRLQAMQELARSREQALELAERAQAERRLLDATFDAVPAAIITADAQGRLLRMNRAIDQIWGDAPLSQGVDEYREWKGWWADGSARHGQRVQPQEWGLARALHGERCTQVVEVEPFGRPGERRVTLLSAAPVLDPQGQVTGGVVAQVDITDTVRAEQALRESEARFRDLADNIPQLAWMSDAEGNLYWFNQRWFDFTGLAPEQMAGEGWRKVHHPEHLERVLGKFVEHLRSGEPWEDTFPMRRRDGEFRWFLSRARPVRDELGRVVRWFGTNTDVTDQMNTESALRGSQERLRARESALREADRQKDTFLATLAHELRNPLAPIRSAAQIIRLRGVQDEKVRTAGAVIERQSAQLARLVDDLMDVSRLNFGNMSLQRQVVDLRQVVDSALEASRPPLQAAGHVLEVHLPEQALMVEVDETRVAQCISNLVNNAGKFTPAPGGRITVDLRARGDGWASVAVRDNGQGISREMLGKVFELFAQEQRSGLGGNSGLGIGLALTRKLIEMHGGHVFGRSEGEGRGAEFEILLPLLTQAGPPERPAGDQEARPMRSARVLVVDDNRDAAETLQLLLEMQGHEVFTAFDGATALAAVTRHQPHVVVLDIGLPDMTGYDVAARIRGEAVLPFRPLLVAVTGWGQPRDQERAREAGFDHHMTKPADPERLAMLVVEHMRRLRG